MNNKKVEINAYLAEIAGLSNIETDEQSGIVYAARLLENKPSHVASIQAPVDFTKDWNLLIPLAIQVGIYPNIKTEEELANFMLNLILQKEKEKVDIA